jgi:hypothetical protein
LHASTKEPPTLHAFELSNIGMKIHPKSTVSSSGCFASRGRSPCLNAFNTFEFMNLFINPTKYNNLIKLIGKTPSNPFKKQRKEGK